MLLTLIISKNCSTCKTVEKQIYSLIKYFPQLKIEVSSIKKFKEHEVFIVPALFVEDKLFAYGEFEFTKLRKLIESYYQQNKGDVMSEPIIDPNVKNPLADLISDEVYEKLRSRGLINEKNVRDRIIRNKFKYLRQQNHSAGEAIDIIREDYPYLQFDSIRKIIYQKNTVH